MGKGWGRSIFFIWLRGVGIFDDVRSWFYAGLSDFSVVAGAERVGVNSGLRDESVFHRFSFQWRIGQSSIQS